MKRHSWRHEMGQHEDEQRCIYCQLERTQISNRNGPNYHWEHWVVSDNGRGRLYRELRESPGPCAGSGNVYAAYEAQRHVTQPK
jgi:hypothetical protein